MGEMSKTPISIPAYKTFYVAAPKGDGKDAPIILKSIVLEQGANVNKWSVDEKEFPKVAEQYRAGRQLRINHSKDVQDVIGKSFDAKVLKGSELEGYLGKKVDGVDPTGMYVTAEFEANPQDPQVRTNLLSSYVDTGSIGLDASPFCSECGEPLKVVGDGFERPCHHLDANVTLRDVEVKEYSYVAEPAFQHTKLFPSFAAAVSTVIKHSSLSETEPIKTNSMPDSKVEEPPKTVESKIEVTAKKGEAEGDAAALAKAYAESEYKRGLAEGRLKAMEDMHDKEKEEKEAKAEASASVKTDQVTKAVPEESKPKNDWLAKVLSPTAAFKADSAMMTLLKGASEASGCPPEIRARIRGFVK